MRRLHSVLIVLLLTISAPVTLSQGLEADMSMNEHLKVFEPYLGKTWRGEFKGSTPEKPMIDISHWERALNGQAVRILHSVNNGEYGGESIIVWDEGQKSLVYYYFTTAGFYTSGSMTFADGKIVSLEKVSGHEGGITEVRSTGEILADGKLRSKAQFLKEGQWIDGHEIIYTEDPAANVVFK